LDRREDAVDALGRALLDKDQMVAQAAAASAGADGQAAVPARGGCKG
jgi:hypothetical protein